MLWNATNAILASARGVRRDVCGRIKRFGPKMLDLSLFCAFRPTRMTMPARVAAPSVLRCVINQALGGAPVINVLHVRQDRVWFSPFGQELLLVWRNMWTTCRKLIR
jgi:hypothetical protein